MLPLTLNRLLRIPLLLFSFFIFSCSKDKVAGPQGAQGPQGPAGNSPSTPTGDIKGKIALYNENGDAVADNSGVTVSIENSSPALTANSGSDGSFIISSASAGTYNLKIEKPGFGTMRLLNFAHAGSKQPTQAGILETSAKLSSQYDIKELIVDTTSFESFKFLVITIKLANPRQIPHPVVLLYMSDSPGAGPEHNEYMFRFEFYQQNDSTLVFSPFDQQLSAYSDKLASADWVYMSAALDNPKYTAYTDEQGKQVLPSSGTLSNEVKVYNVLK